MAADNYKIYAQTYTWLLRRNNVYYCRICVLAKKSNSFTQGKHTVLVDKYLKRHEVCADHVEAVSEQSGTQPNSATNQTSTTPLQRHSPFQPHPHLVPQLVPQLPPMPPFTAHSNQASCMEMTGNLPQRTPPLPAGCVEIAPIPDPTSSDSMTPTPVIELPNSSLFPESQSQTVPKIIDAEYLRSEEGRKMCILLLSSRRCMKSVMDWFLEFGSYLEWDVGKDLIGCKYCRQANSFGALALGKPLRMMSRGDIQVHENTNNHRMVMRYFQSRKYKPQAGERIGVDSSTSRDLVVTPDRGYLGQGGNRLAHQEAHFSQMMEQIQQQQPWLPINSYPVYPNEEHVHIPQRVTIEALSDAAVANRMENILANRFGRTRTYSEMFREFPWLEMDMATLLFYCRFCRHSPNGFDGVMTRGKPVDKTKRGDLVVHEQTFNHNEVMKRCGQHDMVWRNRTNGTTNNHVPTLNLPNHVGTPIPILPELQHMCDQYPKPASKIVQNSQEKHATSQKQESRSIRTDDGQEQENQEKKRKEKPLHIGIEDSIMCDSPSPASREHEDTEKTVSQCDVGKDETSTSQHSKMSELATDLVRQIIENVDGKRTKRDDELKPAAPCYNKQENDTLDNYDKILEENLGIDPKDNPETSRKKDRKNETAETKNESESCATNTDVSTRTPSDHVAASDQTTNTRDKIPVGKTAAVQEYSDGESTAPSTPKSDSKTELTLTQQTESLSNNSQDNIGKTLLQNIDIESGSSSSTMRPEANVVKTSNARGSQGLVSSEVLLDSCGFDSHSLDTYQNNNQTYKETFWNIANRLRQQRGFRNSFCDVKFYLIYPNRVRATFQAHKLILACASDFWRAKFENEANDTFVIESHNVNCSGMEGLMNFLYGQNINGGKQYLTDCYKAAKFLNIPCAVHTFKTLLELNCPKLEYLNTTLDVRVTSEISQSEIASGDASTKNSVALNQTHVASLQSHPARDKRKLSCNDDCRGSLKPLKRRASQNSRHSCSTSNFVSHTKNADDCGLNIQNKQEANRLTTDRVNKHSERNNLRTPSTESSSCNESCAAECTGEDRDTPSRTTIVSYTFGRKSLESSEEIKLETMQPKSPLHIVNTTERSEKMHAAERIQEALENETVLKPKKIKKKCYICGRIRCTKTAKFLVKCGARTDGVTSHVSRAITHRVTWYRCYVCSVRKLRYRVFSTAFKQKICKISSVNLRERYRMSKTRKQNKKNANHKC